MGVCHVDFSQQMSRQKDFICKGLKTYCVYYRLQRSWAKVIFLHLSVILLTGGYLVWSQGGYMVRSRGVYLVWSRGGGCTWQTPPDQVPPLSRSPQTRYPPTRYTLPDQVPPPDQVHPPRNTDNERPVRILLECILVECSFTVDAS